MLPVQPPLRNPSWQQQHVAESPCELQSKLLEGGYIGDNMAACYRDCSGGC